MSSAASTRSSAETGGATTVSGTGPASRLVTGAAGTAPASPGREISELRSTGGLGAERTVRGKKPTKTTSASTARATPAWASTCQE